MVFKTVDNITHCNGYGAHMCNNMKMLGVTHENSINQLENGLKTRKF
jgi:hypothetical protein